jgi:colanic acid/amylovoran biosynthesis glycosyltransferase
MGRAGRARVEAKYDTNKLNDELVEIYQQQLMQIKGVDKR